MSNTPDGKAEQSSPREREQSPPPQPPPQPPRPQPPPPPQPPPRPPQHARQADGELTELEQDLVDGDERTGSRSSDETSTAAMFAYLFVWLGGLIVFLVHHDREVRFHAAQSILVFGGLAVVSAVLSIVHVGGLIIPMILWLLFVLSFGLWVFLSFQGYRLRHVKLPLLGNVAERWADAVTD